MLSGLVVIGTFGGIFLLLLVAQGLGARFGAKVVGPEDPNVANRDGAVLALAGLLLAFSFGSAQSRLESRRQSVLNEANAIGTAYRLVDLATTDADLRPLFRDYTSARTSASERLPDLEAAQEQWAKSHLIGQEIWDLAVRGTAGTESNRMLLLGALNTMLDEGTIREEAVHVHTPWPIYALLIFATTLATFLVGRQFTSPATRWSINQLALPILFAGVLTLLMDLEHPRMGLIQIRASDQIMQDLLDSMNREPN